MTFVTRYARFAPSALVLALAALAALPVAARAGNDGVVPQHDAPKGYRPEARIEEKIGTQVPVDLTFRDENDRPITVGAAMNNKPTILVPVYYRCPMLCTKVLNGLLEAVRQMPASGAGEFTAGKQFTIVIVSMDPKEFGDLARRKKDAYLNGDPHSQQPGYGREGAENGWRFLTGTKENIATLLDSVGYIFEFDKMLQEYNHPSGLIILSPQGKVTRYFYGVGYEGEFETSGDTAAWAAGRRPELTEAELRARREGREFTRPTTTLRLSLIEAADGKGGSLWDKITLLCYRYDSLHQGYKLNVLWAVRIGGIITLTALVAGVLWALRRERRKTNGTAATGNTNPTAQAPARGVGEIV